MSNPKDIWSAAPEGEEGLPEDKMMAYLEGKLSPEEEHEVELWLGNEGMESDALEGLQALPPEEARKITGQLNQQLRQTMGQKARKRRRGIADQRHIWIAVVTILLLIVACFAVIHLLRKGHKSPETTQVSPAHPDQPIS